MKSLLVSAGMCAALTAASAHGLGLTLEEIVGGHVVDIDFDTPELVAGEPTRINVILWDRERTEAVSFTDVWVRIALKEGSGVTFAGNLSRPGFGSAGMVLVFPRDGEYELTVRFRENEQTIAEASFPLAVAPQAGETRDSSSDFLLGAFLGVAAAWVIGRLLRKTADK